MLIFYLSLLTESADKSKFEQLYLTYRNIMMGVSVKILKDTYDAEDAVHQAFIKILSYLDNIDDVHSPKTRLFMVIVTRNISINIYNNRKRSSIISYDEADKVNTAKLNDETIFEKINRNLIIEQLNNLPPQYKDILYLKYYESLSIKQIADLLNLSVPATKKRLQRARAKLSEVLKDIMR